ncbi:hypothetical protein CBS101457_004725 [Exobasidium rhododendri]|nr:hypothetical protein CBS101457_004725 [Exobasidium rhododendri]
MEHVGDATVVDDPAEEPSDSLDGRATILLGIQHASSSFSYRGAEFAFPLYFVYLFTNTLLPASLYGFLTTGVAIVFSGSVGSLVDRYKIHRLRIVRFFIFSQKALITGSYSLFYVLFVSDTLRLGAENGGRGPNPSNPTRADVWSVFAAITFLGSFLILANVGVSVSVERDWVTSISEGSPRRLVRLNAIMRRIDLLSKLLAPLFVSLLTSVTSYAKSCIILLALNSASSLFELYFIGIVYRRFIVLGKEEARHRIEKQEREQQGTTINNDTETYPPRVGLASITRLQGSILHTWLKEQYMDWRTFMNMPIFISSLSISLLYMSVLSFDSTFIAYLKSETTYSDAFIAGMRGVCVVTGLLGTFLSPYLTSKIGLIRTGSWSLWAELVPLSLTIVSFYRGVERKDRPAWNTALLFTGLALSRIGLWSFDLAQLAQVQNALSLHPRRNALMGLQFALQNLLDLFHYAMTIIFSKPSSFKIPADISYAAIGVATLLYVTIYARKERGHLIHLDKFDLQALIVRKQR